MQLLREESVESTQQTNVRQQPQQQEEEQQQQQQNKMDKFYPPKPKINALNELFTCHLCQGYMINPTTIDVCMHTYCRSCIARHLAADCYCPQCKNSDGKTINISNLKSDDILRSVIFKLVPGLYQKERERLVQFVNNTKNEENLIGSSKQSLSELLETDDELFSPTDPISLSLEYHPILAAQCPDGAVPPVRYLQCPASVKIHHLKRFVCSKFDLDPCNRRVGIDIIYEDEVLPSDFTLMDVGYCYKWERHAPMKFAYRILIYNETDNSALEKSNAPCIDKSLVTGCTTNKPATFTKQKTPISVNCEAQQGKLKSPASPSTTHSTKVKSSKSSSSSKYSPISIDLEVPVKVTISRKSTDSKKTVSKKSSSSDEFVLPTTTTNDFKSLRSNDIRFSDYAITSSTTSSGTNVTKHNNSSSNNSLTKKSNLTVVKAENPAKCDIVVSIPHNQMQEEWESKPLSQMKTASKKSPNSSTMENATVPAKKVRNVPKLKIELNSLKTKLIEKPKSADIRLDTLMGRHHHHHRPRKFSLDEPQPVMDKVDLETYVKNIGLKPIEIQTTTATNTPEAEVVDKFTPNASPMSSSSSSTTSSSTGNFNFTCSADMAAASSSSSSSHRKRKKKHSKDSRESKDSKRKKMHAEISSHSAEESLKMKVKLTTPLSSKASRQESKKSPPALGDKLADPLVFEKPKSPSNRIVMTLEKPLERREFETSNLSESKVQERVKDKSKSRSSESKKSKSLDSKKLKDKSKPLEIKIALTNPNSRIAASAKSGNNDSQTKEFDDDEDLVIPDTTTTLSFNKSLNTTIQETKLPHSPPLPPSLFKTTPLTFSTFSPNVTTVAKPKAVAMPKESKDKPKTPHVKLIAPKPIAAKPVQPSAPSKSPQFAVPNPPRFMPNSSTKFLSTPTSIASSANKHMGHILKRSMSLDDNKAAGSANKHARLEKPNQITVSAYGSNLHMTKVEIPATPTSSTAKATYEIPLYSPLSASYNPKCSFSVNKSTSAAKAAKVSMQHSMTSNTTSSAKQTFTVNTATNSNKTNVEVVKKTTDNDIKPISKTTNTTTAATATTTTTSSMVGNNNSSNNNNKSATLMGPPLSMQKLNSGKAVLPTTVTSPPLSTTVMTLHTTAPAKTPQHTPVLNTAYLSSPLSMVTYRQSKVLLAHGKPTNLPELKTEITTATVAAAIAAAATTTTAAATTTNGLATDKPKSSLREFRLPSRDSQQDILDLSSIKVSSNGLNENKPLTPTTPMPATATAGSTLEMALNKIKQNMTNSISNSDGGVKKQELLPISDDLLNLHMLSESATAREKIAISSAATAATSPPASLYEKPKINQNTLVRQQNASVRNIPNPSALAFRNQQHSSIIPPMVTIAVAALSSNLNNDSDKSLILKHPSPPKSPQSPNCSTSSSTSPTRSASKKHPSIDQVAASLNIRASAAAEASAKANSKHLDESAALVTSTSSSHMERAESKVIKQETTEMTQCETGVAQPSSTVNTGLVPFVEIKKEPEEKCADTQVEDATEMKTVFSNSLSSKKHNMVEKLVTSVINVTTPTSTLLTASSAGY